MLTELIIAVNVALEHVDGWRCAAADADRDGRVGVHELVSAVANLLDDGRVDCSDFHVPPRREADECADVAAAEPDRLVPCAKGSGHLGRWAIDGGGLPAYDFEVEQRCDPAGRAYSPRTTVLRDPIHLLGNGRGLVAMAHASGAVEIYTQDRGHKWINRVDTWNDPEDPDYPPQVGGGFNYYVVHRAGTRSDVRSTRFEDLPIATARQRQSRRFGVGYYETETADGDLVVKRRVLAPDAEARALVAEVTIENRSDDPIGCDLVELWDVNVHQIPVELLTSDLLAPGITEGIDRRRRALMGGFTQRIEWNADERIAIARTTAKSLPEGIDDRSDPSDVDWFPDPIFLAVLDGAMPSAVWLSDGELWSGQKRTPPAALAAGGDARSRAIEIDGAGQHGVLALRVAVDVPAHGSATRRFAFGYAPAGSDPGAAVAELRARAATLRDETQSAWKSRLVWAAFPGLPDAGVVQREIAWAAYNALANTTYDEYRGVRLLGQGGSYKYVHGLDGAMGDLALFAESILLVDPAIAADTLAYALASQLGPETDTPWRFPYATTGVGSFSDVLIYGQRSDAYYFLPAAIGRYVALSRDFPFLDRAIPFWPRVAGASGDVLEHICRGLEYGTETLGFGARGLVAIGTGDYADGINSLATEPATPRGTSSTYNAGAIVYGFPLAAGVVEAADPSLASDMRALADSQSAGLLDRSWEGNYFFRGFVDSGNPLAPHVFFLEPQLFPTLAGIVDTTRRDLSLGRVVDLLETDIGAVSNVALADVENPGGIDQPLIGGIWPVANAWLTAAYARRDAHEAWSSFIRNTLAAHAEKYPELWYGIWTGPDSFNGPDHERPGEADAHLATALTDYPALNAHMHTSPLRALVDLAGIEGTAEGLRIMPRVPTETFSVVWPRLRLDSTPLSLCGSFTASVGGPVLLEIALPSGLREGAGVRVSVDGTEVSATISADLARFTLPARAGEPVEWCLERP